MTTTYLEIMNDLMATLRDETVVDVAQDSHALLMGRFINDAKRQVEDACDWSAYLEERTVTTVIDQRKYGLLDSDNRVNIDYIVSNVDSTMMQERPRRMIQSNQLTGSSTATGNPHYWCNNGVDSAGDAQIEITPTPSAVSTLTVVGWWRKPKLLINTDTIIIPVQPVLDLAIAFAVRERGEVTGQTTAEYFELAKRTLSDAIAYDSSRNDDEDVWYVS